MPYKYNSLEGTMCLVEGSETTFVLDQTSVRSAGNKIGLQGGVGIRTSGSGASITVIVTPDFVNQFADSAGNPASGNNYRLNLVGSGPISSAASAGQIAFNIADASTTNKGAAQFDGSLFSVTSGIATVKDASTTNKGVSQFDSNYFAVSSGIATILNASTTNKGAAQFDAASFSTANGLVSLNTVQPSKGGTGQTSLAKGSLIVGNDANALSTLMLQDGQVAIGVGTYGARAGYVTTDSSLNCTTNNGYIQISNPAPAMQYTLDTAAAVTLGNGYGSIFRGNSLGVYTLYYSNYYVANREYRIIGGGPALWQINLQAGQSVSFGNQTATTSIAATHKNDTLHMYALDANTYFVLSSIGNLSIT